MKRFWAFFSLSVLMNAGLVSVGYAISLDLGADDTVRAIAEEGKTSNEPSPAYFTQRLQLYMGTKLSKDVEAQFKLQSITPWGLEGSTTAAAVQNTRYPSANGTPWIQTAFVRVPKIFNEPIQLTIGRQPIAWGDGLVLTDDELGFDAIRLQAASPWHGIPLDSDLFYAKINEGLNRDFGLAGVLLGIGTEKTRRLEVYWLDEENGSGTPYQAGSETATVTSSQISRRFLGVRLAGMIKSAYYKLEYARQSGFARRFGSDPTLQGSALTFGTGGTLALRRLGQANGFFNFAMGSGDSPGDGTKDGAFRPTFAHRWDGLERSGYGRYFAATVSDAFSTGALFSNSSSAQTGLPPGTSGLQIIGGGIGYSPTPPLKGTVAFFNYKSKENLIASSNSLGSEADFELSYQFTGFLSFRGTYARFAPGDAFSPNLQTAHLTELEAQLHF